MNIPLWVWILTLLGLTALILVDTVIVARRPHEPTFREATIWVCFYVALAVAFGVGVWYIAGPEYGGQFAAGWVTEYSLSVDNLFAFVLIMNGFAVPRQFQQKILLIGIVLAQFMRGAFIAGGAALVHRFVWIFYIFGALLLFTAIKLATHKEDEHAEYRENGIIRFSRRVLPMTRGYEGARLVVSTSGKRMFTPLFIVMIAIATSDLIFAIDSIPAIFGLTTEPYLIFTAGVFALMGLRQLYFLLAGLLDRLAYLSVGISAVLAFIGVKLFLDAMHENNVPFINGGDPVSWAPEIPIWLSLSIILGTLLVATAFSLARARRDTREAARAGAMPSGVMSATSGGVDAGSAALPVERTKPHERG